MTKRLATFAAIVALSAATTVAAQAASQSNPAQNQRENQVTAQLNRQQAQGGTEMGYGAELYPGIVTQGFSGPNRATLQEQIAQPPSDASDLSIIE